MIACLGETTGVPALQNILNQMQRCEEGTNILKDKPRINSTTIDLDALGKLPENTFGFHYKKFLDDNVRIFPFSSRFFLMKIFSGRYTGQPNGGALHG